MNECQLCGKRFIPKSNTSGKFCSVDCRIKAKSSRVERICEQCGKSFSVVGSVVANGGGKYCGKACHDIALQKRVKCICVECGKSFDARVSDVMKGRAKLCSKKCMALAQTGAKNHMWVGGSDDYRGGSWSRQRKLARDRDGGICQLCHRKPKNNERRFHVHHIVKSRYFNGEFDAANVLSNLITLCPQCHAKAEHGLIAVPARLL
jgi:5-methylcytosine-specific restriction endonuclease McrA